MTRPIFALIVLLIASSCFAELNANNDAGLLGVRAFRASPTEQVRRCGAELTTFFKATCPNGCTVKSDLPNFSQACCTKTCSQQFIQDNCCPQ